MANEVVFLLRFDTKAGELQIKNYATFASEQLKKALSVKAPRTFSQLLGLNDALSDIRTLSSEIAKLESNLRQMSTKQLGRLRTRLAVPDPITGIVKSTPTLEAIDRISAEKVKEANINVAKSLAAESAAQRDRTLSLNRITAKRIELERKALTSQATAQDFNTLQKLHSKNPQTGRGQFDEVFAMSEAKREADRKKRVEAGRRFVAAKELGLTSEAETLEDFTKENELKKRKFIDRVNKQAKANKIAAAEAFATAKKAGLTREGENFRTFFNQPNLLSERQATFDRRTELRRRVGNTSPISNFTDIKAAEKSYALKWMVEQHREYDKKGRPSAIQKLFGAREVSREDFISNARMKAKFDFSKQGRIGPEQALGISPTATRLLALSSVLQPLNAQLGMVAMQAGFAAFSLGAPVAALALLSAAVGGFRNLLMKSVDAAKAAGLETTKYNRATTQWALEVQGFLRVLGVKTQQTFVPVVDEMTRMFKEIEKLPWDELIGSAATASTALLGIVNTFNQLHKLSGIRLASSANQFLQDKAGLRGSQRIDMGKVLSSGAFGGFGPLTGFSGFKTLFKEMKEVFQPVKDEQFVYTPKFGFEQIENLHRSIQESIFKAQSADPQTKALEAQTNVIRDEFGKTRQADSDNMKSLLQSINSRVPTAVAAP